MNFIKIALVSSLLFNAGCSTKETTISDGNWIPYKRNILMISVIDANEKPISGAAVSVGDEYSDIAYGLIDEIDSKPLITDINGLVTLTVSGIWGKEWSTSNECILEGENRYCRNIYRTEQKYTENILIKKEGFKPIKANYNKVISCREVGASCQTKITNNSSFYLVQYKVTLTQD